MSLAQGLTDFELAEKNPTVFSLAQKLDPILEQYGLQNHTAQCALLLDYSGSMDWLYEKRRGAKSHVEVMVERMVPFALRWDDNGVIDTWLFDTGVSELHDVTLDNLDTAVADMTKNRRMGTTNLHAGLSAVVDHYEFRSLSGPAEFPTYLICITDGRPDNASSCTRLIEQLSKYGMFIQFVAIGEDWPTLDMGIAPGSAPAPAPPASGGFMSKISSMFGGGDSSSSSPTPRTRGMQYLVSLDEELDTEIDAVNAFAVENPATVDETRLYSLMTREYPGWLPQAKSAGLIAA